MKNTEQPKKRNSVEVFPLPEGIRVEKDVPVVMRDGVRISTNVFRPDKEGRFPVMMSFSPYGKDIDPAKMAQETEKQREAIGLSLGSYRISECTPFEAPDPAYWVPNDYVVVHVDSRGYHKSEGKPGVYSKAEIDDYLELIEWAGTQSWSNGNVGLNGISYLAIVQWFAAERRPPHLKAIIPWEGISDPYRDIMYHGGVPETAFYRMWSSRMSGASGQQAQAAQSRTPLIQDLKINKARLEDINVPALICGSWSDQGCIPRAALTPISGFLPNTNGFTPTAGGNGSSITVMTPWSIRRGSVIIS